MRDGEWLPVPASSNAPLNWHRGWSGFMPLPIASGGAVLLAIGSAIDRDPSALIPAMVGIVGLAISAVFFLREHRFRELAIRPDEAAMLHEIDVPDAVLVSVWLVQGSAITGRDRGAMWIENGRLLFSGPRMSFSLPRNRVEAYSAKARGPGEFELRLNRLTPVGSFALSVAPLIGDRPFATPLDRTVERWLEAPSASFEEGQWPPLALGPEALGADRLRGRWVAKRCGGALSVCFLGLPFALVLGVPSLFSGLLVAGLLASFAVPSLARTGAIRDRRALEDR